MKKGTLIILSLIINGTLQAMEGSDPSDATNNEQEKWVDSIFVEEKNDKKPSVVIDNYCKYCNSIYAKEGTYRNHKKYGLTHYKNKDNYLAAQSCKKKLNIKPLKKLFKKQMRKVAALKSISEADKVRFRLLKKIICMESSGLKGINDLINN